MSLRSINLQGLVAKVKKACIGRRHTNCTRTQLYGFKGIEASLTR